MPNCPECTARAKKKVQAKYDEETPEESRSRDDLIKLFDEIEIPMKMDTSTKHFICKRCGLYATREQVSDIRDYEVQEDDRILIIFGAETPEEIEAYLLQLDNQELIK